MPREQYRKLIDNQGNEYAISIPNDVSADDITDIMVSVGERIVKLKGYRLVGDVWRLPDTIECEDNGFAFNFYKKIKVFEKWPELQQNDFGAIIQDLLGNARDVRINRASLTSFEGKPVLKDNRGYYLKRTLNCVAENCSTVIDGTQRLSLNNGEISRAQSFIPEDENAVRVRQGSKSWLCAACAPKNIPVPQPTPEIPSGLPNLPPSGLESSEKVVASPVTKTAPRPDDDLRELLKLADWKSEVPMDWLKGYMAGVLRARLK